MDAAATRRMRGWILQFLAEPTPEGGEYRPMASDYLTELLASAAHQVVREEVEKELAYLNGKKLVTIEPLTGIAKKMVRGAMLVRITSAGRDIVDGTTTDPGINMGAFAS